MAYSKISYQIVVNPGFLGFSDIISLLHGKRSSIVDEDFIKQDDIANLIKIGAVKIIPLGIDWTSSQTTFITKKKKKKEKQVVTEPIIPEEVEEPINTEKDGVD